MPDSYNDPGALLNALYICLVRPEPSVKQILLQLIRLFRGRFIFGGGVAVNGSGSSPLLTSSQEQCLVAGNFVTFALKLLHLD